ncbi:unnamed protein product, partial [Closterium sp. NIES-53]
MARGGKPKRGKGKSKGTRAAPRPERMETAAPAAEGTSRPAVWRPGVDDMEDGEELQFDPTAYNCLHQFRLNWPCLRCPLSPPTPHP